MNAKWTSLINPLSSLFLAAVLLFAGIDKLLHYGGFIRALQSYVIVPDSLGPYLALSLILVELGIGLGLLVSRWRRGAAQAATALLVIFTAALAVNTWVDPEAICGCWFTITLSQSTSHHILQNLLMAGVAASVAMSEPDPMVSTPTGGTAASATP